MSQFFFSGVRTRPSVRGALPSVNGAARLHAAGLNQAPMRSMSLPLVPGVDARDRVRPLTAAEQAGVVVRLEDLHREAALIGADAGHRPAAEQRVHHAARRIQRLPSPNGSSNVPVMFTRCGVSSSERPYSRSRS